MRPFPVGKIYAAIPDVGEGCDAAVAAPRPPRTRGYTRLSVIPSGSPFVNRQSSSIEIRSRPTSDPNLPNSFHAAHDTIATLAASNAAACTNVVPENFIEFIGQSLLKNKNAFSLQTENAATLRSVPGASNTHQTYAQTRRDHPGHTPH
jgi:hypothetical protein